MFSFNAICGCRVMSMFMTQSNYIKIKKKIENLIASFVYKITFEVDSFDRANMSNNGFIYGLNTHLLDFLASLKKHVSLLTQFRN